MHTFQHWFLRVLMFWRIPDSKPGISMFQSSVKVLFIRHHPSCRQPPLCIPVLQPPAYHHPITIRVFKFNEESQGSKWGWFLSVAQTSNRHGSAQQSTRQVSQPDVSFLEIVSPLSWFHFQLGVNHAGWMVLNENVYKDSWETKLTWNLNIVVKWTHRYFVFSFLLGRWAKCLYNLIYKHLFKKHWVQFCNTGGLFIYHKSL